MSGLLGSLGRAVLFRFDPETAHRMAIRALSLNLHPAAARPDPRLAVELLGMDFPSPVGLAAGFDKNAVAVDGLLKLGFGFVEIGSVTPRPQPGNSRPRLFRLEADRAVINRMGFNNDGHEAIRQRLAARAGRPGIVGVNLGANKDSADRIADYEAGVRIFAALASYLAINVSSPNTPGLRGLQAGDVLPELLRRVMAARDTVAAGGRRTPVLVKIAPDLGAGDLEAIATAVLGAGIDGIIVSNTTVGREGLKPDPHAAETGGLSGRPLFRRSTALLARTRKLVGPDLALIGAGGIEDGATAWEKLAAGANLVQVYTGMIYDGPGIAAGINRDLTRRLDATTLDSIAGLTGSETERWTREPF